MKLISVKILGDDFRSLKANKLYAFNHSFRTDRLSTKVFAGLNGSGKSNFLELFSEIFYFLELYLLSTGKGDEKKGIGFGFEIEYYLPNKPIFSKIYRETIEDEFVHVIIRKPIKEAPEFALKSISSERSERVEVNRHELLPTRVVAYTSGQNELLSNPYYKIKYHYLNEFEKKKDIATSSVVENDRLFFLDYSSNFSIFIANQILGEEKKVKYLNKILKLAGLQSFRITLNLMDYRQKPIALDSHIEDSIRKLKRCATVWKEEKEGKKQLLILDFWIDKDGNSIKAFKHFFGNAFNLFKVFYGLEILNLHLVPVDTRSQILRARKSFNFTDDMQQPDPSKLVFRIEAIQVKKIVGEPPETIKSIYYRQLSDGEHQFNEIIGSVLMMEEEGCLFLMDEPDTHFNPLWRAKLVKLLNYVSAKEFDESNFPAKVRNQEFIVTTHSPFVISDSQREDVYKFDKTDEGVIYSNPKIETYGSSVSLLLEVIFNRDASISDFSNDELDEMRHRIMSMKEDEIEDVKERLLDFGESIEKFDVYSLLRKREEFLTQQR